MRLQQGALETLYYYLWFPNEQTHGNKIDFQLPQTVIYRLGVIQAWYFTSVYSDIQVKRLENRTIDNIEKAFLKNTENDIVAYFINCSHKRSFYNSHETRCEFLKDQLNVDCTTSILYLNKQQFVQFLKSSDINRNGILQKFVQPTYNHETVIQAIWSENVLLLSQRVNLKFLDNHKLDVQEKCATFNSTDIYSRPQPVKSQIQTNQIKKLIEYLVTKIRMTTFEKHIVNRIVIYCKYDRNNQLNFLYCTNIRSNDEYPFPIKYGLKYRPNNISNQVTTNLLKPVQLLLDVECITCSEMCQSKDLHEIHYRDIVKHKRHYRMEIKPYSARVKKPESIEQDQDYEEYVGNTTKLIPDLFKKLYPNLDHQSYKVMLKNEAFLNQTTHVCDKCYSKYTLPQTKLKFIQPIGKSRSITDLIQQAKHSSTRSINNIKIGLCLTQRNITPQDKREQESNRNNRDSKDYRDALRSTRVCSGYSSADAKKRIFSCRTTPQRRMSMEELTQIP